LRRLLSLPGPFGNVRETVLCGWIDEWASEASGILPPPNRFSRLFVQPLRSCMRRMLRCALEARFCCSARPSEQKTDHGHTDPGLFASNEQRIVPGQPAPCGQPGERALCSPSIVVPSGAHTPRSPLNDLYTLSRLVRDPVREPASGRLPVRPDQRHARKASMQWPPQGFVTRVILPPGMRDQHVQDRSLRVHQRNDPPLNYSLSTLRKVMECCECDTDCRGHSRDAGAVQPPAPAQRDRVQQWSALAFRPRHQECPGLPDCPEKPHP